MKWWQAFQVEYVQPVTTMTPLCCRACGCRRPSAEMVKISGWPACRGCVKHFTPRLVRYGASPRLITAAAMAAGLALAMVVTAM